MFDKIKEWINSYTMIRPDSRILAACSGGPDSLALVHILHRLKAEIGFGLAVAHVNHMFRPEAAKEAEFVAAFSHKLGLRCSVTAIDVPAYSKTSKTSPEEAGRFLRYRYLRQVAAEWGGAQIATGHHKDDQVETVLLNFLRGAGSAGLRGMQPVNGDIIRPLLAVSRSEIEVYCREQGLQPCYDSSNFTPDYRRNRIRLELLPALEKTYNPSVREAIWRLASLAGDEYRYICREAAKQWDAVVVEGETLTIDGQALTALPKALQRELIRQAIEKKKGSLTGISFDHVEKLLTMALEGMVGLRLTLPGRLTARKTYTGLELLNHTLAREMSSMGSKPERTDVVVPGITNAGSIHIVAEIITEPTLKQGKQTALFDFEQLVLPLIVRTRLPGDRFRPLGLGGSKKIKEFFIDRKVPEAQRDFVPIVADQQEILWVAGYRQSEHGRITKSTKKILRLSITK